MFEWEYAIVQAIHQLGGSASLSDFVDVIEAHQMYMGGGAHDYGDPDSCATCENSSAKKPPVNTP